MIKRIAEQVLEYMHVPHDIEPKNQTLRQTLMASAKKNDDDAIEGSDRLGAPLIPEPDDTSAKSPAKSDQHVAVIPNSAPLGGAKIVDVSTGPAAPTPATSPDADTLAALSSPGVTAAQAAAGKGTVVLDVDSGVVVPSFMGKSLRSAVEVAQQSGLEISVLGSGIARQQSPPPGSHLPVGQKVMIRFSH